MAGSNSLQNPVKMKKMLHNQTHAAQTETSSCYYSGFNISYLLVTPN